MTYTNEELKANVRTHIPDFDMATEIMGMISRAAPVDVAAPETQSTQAVDVQKLAVVCADAVYANVERYKAFAATGFDVSVKIIEQAIRKGRGEVD